jgi:C-terminal processing protease CtpA/Prc
MEPADILRLIRGEQGRKVSITMLRNSKEVTSVVECSTKMSSPSNRATNSYDEQLCGIGLQFKSRVGMPVVCGIKPDSPCQGLDITAGDILVQVDATRIAKGIKAVDVFNLVRGPRGSLVSLTFVRPPMAESPASEAHERSFQIVRRMKNVLKPRSCSPVNVGEQGLNDTRGANTWPASQTAPPSEYVACF